MLKIKKKKFIISILIKKINNTLQLKADNKSGIALITKNHRHPNGSITNNPTAEPKTPPIAQNACINTMQTARCLMGKNSE